MSSLVIGVVGDEHTSGSSSIAWISLKIDFGLLLGLFAHVQAVFLGVLTVYLVNSGLLSNVNHLQQLRGLATRRSAHVKDSHARAQIHEHRWDHTDNLLSADVSNASLGDEELLEGGEGWEFSDDVLGRGHPPGKLIGVPWHSQGWLDGATILMLNLDDFGDISGLEKSLDSERMAGAG